MTDRRELWSNGRVAHISLEKTAEADSFVAGEDNSVIFTPVAAIRDTPFGKIERQLLTGARFCVLEVKDGWAFGFSPGNSYTGYIERQMLKPTTQPATHVVRNRLTMALNKPDFKTRTEEVLLSIGTQLAVGDDDGSWSRVVTFSHDMYVPTRHLRPIASFDTDPVAVAEDLLGTPYVWGGNSAIGIDCSGLVQLACDLCGIPCPGDSDQQAKALGKTLPPDTPPKRGDILFWKGHVGWVSDPDTLLHANAHHMAVAFEPLNDAIARINAQGDGPVIRHARLTRR